MGQLHEIGAEAPVFDDLAALPAERKLAAVDARELLLGELALAYPPLTGRQVGCVLETEEGQFFSGHNYEHQNPVRFDHAEANTLAAMPPSANIRSIYMAGADPRLTGQQFKNITPCSECYESLEPQLTPEADLVLFEPNRLGHALVFSAGEYRPAYGMWPYSELSATNRKGIMEELREKTPMDERDRAVVADLRLFGLERGVEFYLTGSASGRGWMSTAIHNKLGTGYGDMDILAVASEYDKETLRQAVHTIVNEQYGAVSSVETDTNYWVICGENRGTERHVVYDSFFDGEEKIMDFSQAATLKEGMLRDDYLANNFYHKVS